jgi:hypothetical protein
MYFSYMLGVPILLGLLFTVIKALPKRPFPLQFFVAWLVFLAFVPLVFRYSRVLWLHIDRLIDPPM